MQDINFRPASPQMTRLKPRRTCAGQLLYAIIETLTIHFDLLAGVIARRCKTMRD
jgi:hypothetical protein